MHDAPHLFILFRLLPTKIEAYDVIATARTHTGTWQLVQVIKIKLQNQIFTMKDVISGSTPTAQKKKKKKTEEKK